VCLFSCRATQADILANIELSSYRSTEFDINYLYKETHEDFYDLAIVGVYDVYHVV
jgi:hypothetical protein